MRLLAWLILFTAVLTGCGSSPTGEPTAAPASPITASDAATTSTPPAPPPVPARPVNISDASTDRLLQASDAPSTYGAQPLPPPDLAASTRLPCATTAPASDTEIVDQNGMTMSFALRPDNGYDSQAAQVLTLYGPGGAARYMSELTAALAACPVDQWLSYTLDASNFGGDESTLIRVDHAPPRDPRVPYVSSWYRVVMRADDVVMVLSIAPFESGSVLRETVDTMLDIAISRAEDA